MNKILKDFIQNYYLNEGKAGYEPMEGDGYSDIKAEITDKILDILIGYAKHAVKNDEPTYAWDIIGVLQFFIGHLDECFMHNNKKIQESLKLYDKLIEICKEKGEQMGWRDYNNFKYELDKNECELQRLIYDKSLDHKRYDEE